MIDSPTIYKIKKDILHILKTRALYYRLRVTEELPQGARVQRISLTDSVSGTVIFDKKINPSSESWSKVLKEYPEKKKKAILELTDTMRKFEVKEYIPTITLQNSNTLNNSVEIVNYIKYLNNLNEIFGVLIFNPYDYNHFKNLELPENIKKIVLKSDEFEINSYYYSNIYLELFKLL